MMIGAIVMMLGTLGAVSFFCLACCISLALAGEGKLRLCCWLKVCPASPRGIEWSCLFLWCFLPPPLRPCSGLRSFATTELDLWEAAANSGAVLKARLVVSLEAEKVEASSAFSSSSDCEKPSMKDWKLKAGLPMVASCWTMPRRFFLSCLKVSTLLCRASIWPFLESIVWPASPRIT